jgi:hypothetical protein
MLTTTLTSELQQHKLLATRPTEQSNQNRAWLAQNRHMSEQM